MTPILFDGFRAVAGRFWGTGLGRVPGVERTYRWLYQTLAPRQTQIVTLDGVRLAVGAADQVIAPALLIGKGYEPFAREVFKRLLRPDMVVADIGANNGYYALWAAQQIGPGGLVFAFEPEARNYDLLVQGIALNGLDNVRAVRKAVSATTAVSSLHLDPHNAGGPSLCAENIPDCREAEMVETTTLDDFFAQAARQPDLLKIDIQGAEALAVAGADRTLRQPDLALIMEFWPFGLRNMGADPTALLRQLEAYGFAAQMVDEERCSLRTLSVAELIARCDRTHSGRGYVDLLLTKRGSAS